MIENKDGILRITDGGAEVYNSSTDELLHYLPPRIDGSVSRDSVNWPGGTAWERRDADILLGTVPAVASDLVGLVRVQYDTGYTHLPPNAWYVAGGSFLLVFKTFQSLSGTWANYVSSVAAVTIYKSGNQLRFQERIRLLDHYMAGPNLNLAGYTLTYRLYPAVFS